MEEGRGQRVEARGWRSNARCKTMVDSCIHLRLRPRETAIWQTVEKEKLKCSGKVERLDILRRWCSMVSMKRVGESGLPFI